MSAVEDEIDDSSAPLIEHLAELRSRLIWCVLAFVIAMCAAFVVADPIFNFLSRPVCQAMARRGQECALVMIKLQEGFFVAIRIAFMGGFVLSFPIIGYQLWRFVAPGLYRSEKRAFLPFMLASPFMFVLGAAFAYYIILPMAFDFFLIFQQGVDSEREVAEGAEALQKAGILYQGSIEEYLSLTIKFILAFGLCFQLPVLLTLMGKAGLISSEGMASVRKYAIVGILMLAAVATPPDVLSQIVLFTAVYGLYEISILLVRGIEKRRAAEEAAEEAELYSTAVTTPAPTDPAPTDPAPTDPAPTDPAPADPAPTEPAPPAPAPASPDAGSEAESPELPDEEEGDEADIALAEAAETEAEAEETGHGPDAPATASEGAAGAQNDATGNAAGDAVARRDGTEHPQTGRAAGVPKADTEAPSEASRVDSPDAPSDPEAPRKPQPPEADS